MILSSSSDAVTSYPIYVTSSSGKVDTLQFTPPAKLDIISATPVVAGPSWIAFDTKTNHAFVIGDNISVLHLDNYGKAKWIGDHKGYITGGQEAVAGCLVDDCLFVANYGSGSASVIPVSSKTNLLESPSQVIQYTRKGVGPVASRQDKSYAHDATASPDGGWVYICDLGSDEIHHIKVNKGNCSQSKAETKSTEVATGSGPRHLTFAEQVVKGKQYAYLASELACTLTAFSHDPTTGELTQIQKPLLTVPNGTALGGSLTQGPQRTTAEVTVSQDGQFVYVSNRGDSVEDHITIFKRSVDGTLSYIDWIPSGGKMPRHFSMSKDEKYLAVAHETSGNVVILKRDEKTGSLSKTGAVVSKLNTPQFAGFYPPQSTV